METYQEITILSRELPAEEIIELVIRFAGETAGWAELPSESEEYSNSIGRPACIIHACAGQSAPSAGVAFAEMGDKKVGVTNINPEVCGELSLDEYNSIARRFRTEFAQYSQGKKLRLAMRTKGPTIGLEDIIRGAKTRKLFERYLRMYPRSGHPLDIRRLDVFTCAVSRYRCSVDLDRLGMAHPPELVPLFMLGFPCRNWFAYRRSHNEEETIQ